MSETNRQQSQSAEIVNEDTMQIMEPPNLKRKSDNGDDASSAKKINTDDEALKDLTDDDFIDKVNRNVHTYCFYFFLVLHNNRQFSA